MVNIISENSDEIIIEIRRNINFVNVEMIKESLNEISKHNLKNIKLDLSSVEIIDSRGIGVLLSYYKSLKNAGRNLCVQNLNSNIKNLFALTGVDRLIDIT